MLLRCGSRVLAQSAVNVPLRYTGIVTARNMSTGASYENEAVKDTFTKMANRLSPDTALMLGEIWRKYKYGPIATKEYLDRLLEANKILLMSAGKDQPDIHMLHEHVIKVMESMEPKITAESHAEQMSETDQIYSRVAAVLPEYVKTRALKLQRELNVAVEMDWNVDYAYWKKSCTKSWLSWSARWESDEEIIHAPEYDYINKKVIGLLLSLWEDGKLLPEDFRTASEIYDNLIRDVKILREDIIKQSDFDRSLDSSQRETMIEYQILRMLNTSPEEFRFLWAGHVIYQVLETVDDERLESLLKDNENKAELILSGWMNDQVKLESQKSLTPPVRNNLSKFNLDDEHNTEEWFEEKGRRVMPIEDALRSNYEFRAEGEMILQQTLERLPELPQQVRDAFANNIHYNAPRKVAVAYEGKQSLIDIIPHETDIYIDLGKEVRARTTEIDLDTEEGIVKFDMVVLTVYSKLLRRKFRTLQESGAFDHMSPYKEETRKEKYLRLYDIRDPQKFWELVREAFMRMGIEGVYPFRDFDFHDLPNDAKNELYLLTESLLQRDSNEHPLELLERLTHTQDDIYYALPHIENRKNSLAVDQGTNTAAFSFEELITGDHNKKMAEAIVQQERKFRVPTDPYNQWHDSVEEIMDASEKRQIDDMARREEGMQTWYDENKYDRSKVLSSFPSYRNNPVSSVDIYHSMEKISDNMCLVWRYMDRANFDHVADMNEEEQLKWLHSLSEEEVNNMFPERIWDHIFESYEQSEQIFKETNLEDTTHDFYKATFGALNSLMNMDPTDPSTAKFDRSGYRSDAVHEVLTHLDINPSEDIRTKIPPGSQKPPVVIQGRHEAVHIDAYDPATDPQFQDGRVTDHMVSNLYSDETCHFDTRTPKSDEPYQSATYWKPEDLSLIRQHGDLDLSGIAPFNVEDQPMDHQVDDPWITLKDNMFRKKACPLCKKRSCKPLVPIDYTNIRMLNMFVEEDGTIIPRKKTGLCAKRQRQVSRALKLSRIMGLMPYSNKWELDKPREPGLAVPSGYYEEDPGMFSLINNAGSEFEVTEFPNPEWMERYNSKYEEAAEGEMDPTDEVEEEDDESTDIEDDREKNIDAEEEKAMFGEEPELDYRDPLLYDVYDPADKDDDSFYQENTEIVSKGESAEEKFSREIGGNEDDDDDFDDYDDFEDESSEESGEVLRYTYGLHPNNTTDEINPQILEFLTKTEEAEHREEQAEFVENFKSTNEPRIPKIFKSAIEEKFHNRRHLEQIARSIENSIDKITEKGLMELVRVNDDILKDLDTEEEKIARVKYLLKHSPMTVLDPERRHPSYGDRYQEFIDKKK